MSARVARGALGALLLALAALGAVPVRVQAQTSTAVLTGSVRDQTGGALPGVTVELLSARDVVASTQTDGRRPLPFRRVSPGNLPAVASSCSTSAISSGRNVAVAAGADA